MEGANWRLSARASPIPSKGIGRQVDVDDLAAGMDPGVGAARTGQQGRLAHTGRQTEGVAQGPRHRRDLGLEGEAAKAAPS